LPSSAQRTTGEVKEHCALRSEEKKDILRTKRSVNQRKRTRNSRKKKNTTARTMMGAEKAITKQKIGLEERAGEKREKGS